ncbi:hypothetical protein GCM10010182_20440 [Actinomadura cremea]|nr:hypothetical protein GCM10010182_20440 [Actinomadura cremea]
MPDPLGPTTAVMPGSNFSVVDDAKDLKPRNVRFFRYTRSPSSSGRYAGARAERAPFAAPEGLPRRARCPVAALVRVAGHAARGPGIPWRIPVGATHDPLPRRVGFAPPSASGRWAAFLRRAVRAIAASLRLAQGLAARSSSRELELGFARDRSGPGPLGPG